MPNQVLQRHRLHLHRHNTNEKGDAVKNILRGIWVIIRCRNNFAVYGMDIRSSDTVINADLPLLMCIVTSITSGVTEAIATEIGTNSALENAKNILREK